MSSRKFRGLARSFLLAATAASSLCVSLPVNAADDFNHLVRIIVPFAPGGVSDILARIIAPKLSTAIGQTVIVENKPGATGNIGMDTVAKAPKDGHTIVLTDIGVLSTVPALFTSMTYDVEKDLAPVGMIMFAPYVLAVHPSMPAKSLPEFIQYAQANPGKVSVANSGIGAVNHLTSLIIAKENGITWKNVPYKGGSAASRAVISGESNMIINSTTATAPFVVNGQLVGLAVTGKERLKNLPNVPTFREVGLPQADAGTFQGVLTTAGTPPAVVKRLSDELRKILAMPEIQQKIAEQGGVIQSATPEDLKAWLQTSIKTYGAEIRAAQLKGE